MRVLTAGLALVITTAASASSPPGVAQSYTESEVKAEFIERITRFVTWPESAFESEISPFAVCVYGTGPVAPHLQRIVARGRIKDRPARFLPVGPHDLLTGCHVLYVATTDRAEVRAVAARALGKPILSVADQPGSAEVGIIVNLVLDAEGHVRLEINGETARVSGLKISAKLMRLAQLVGEQR